MTENIHKEELEKLAQEKILDQAIIHCAKTLLDSLDLDTAMQSLLETLTEYYEGDRSYIFELNHKEGTATNTYEVCVEGVEAQIHHLQDLPISVLSRWMDEFEKSPYMVINSVDQELALSSKEGQVLRDLKISNLLVASISCDDELLGFIGVDNPKKYASQGDLLQVVSGFVRHDLEKHGMSVKVVEAVSEMQRSLDMSRMSFECAKVLLDDGNAELAITRLLELVAEYMGGDTAYVFEFDKKERMLINRLIYGNPGLVALSQRGARATLNEIHLSPKLCTAMEEFLTHDCIHMRMNEKSQEDTSCVGQIFNMLNIESCILAPYNRNGEYQGFLGIDNPRTNIDHKEVIYSVVAFIVNTLEKRGMVDKLAQQGMADELTGVQNRIAYLQRLKELNRKKSKNFAIIFADCKQLKKINQYFGHEVGDDVLLWCVKFLQCYIKDAIYRVGAGEFVCFISGITQERFEERMADIAQAQKRMSYQNLSIGSIWQESVDNLDEMIGEAVKRMEEEKKTFYEQLLDSAQEEEELILQLKQRVAEVNRASGN